MNDQATNEGFWGWLSAQQKKCWVALDQLLGLVLDLALPDADDLSDWEAFGG